MALRVAVVSLGCPKALVDSERMLALLAEAGCLVCAPEEEADVILVNTCAFIRPAREESLRAIRQALQRKGRGACRRVVVAGCLPQRQGRKLLEELPGIDAAIGVFSRDEVVVAVTSDQSPFLRIGRIGQRTCPDDRGRLRLTPRHTAYLRLAEGCSMACSFCTIPAIRGPLRSKPPELVVAEAAELIADGAVELNLIAQDTTAYGSDLADGADLASLLRRLDALPGARWIRVMYANPASLSEPAIEAIAGCPRVVKYLDLPIQHVSDRMLELMNRRYDRSGLERLLARLRERVPGIALRTTLLVGFPGESPEEFRELLDFVRTWSFDALGVFSYWPEPGTPAARLAQQVSGKTRQRRRDQLMELQQRIVFSANAGRVGSSIEVLVDGLDERGRCVARHAGQAPEVDGVCILTRRRPVGRLLRATVTGWDGYDLITEPCAGAPAKAASTIAASVEGGGQDGPAANARRSGVECE